MDVEFQKEWYSKAGSKVREMTLHLKEPTGSCVNSDLHRFFIEALVKFDMYKFVPTKSCGTIAINM